jgi:hypothetical protein
MNIGQMNIVDKLREWQRGERDWNQGDMVREVLEHIEAQEQQIDSLHWHIAFDLEPRHD